jgi:hypothetical protein
MLLALSSVGADSQKKVGQAFVQRLLEKGEVNPAVAILLGLGEQNDAIEVYVSRRSYLEAVLLTCLLFPSDWKRQSYLVRKWGEYAVSHKQAELAVRCFSCTSLESTEPWFSPATQDAFSQAQKESVLGSQLSPPLSPPGGGMPSRMKNSSLKLITNFGDKLGPTSMLNTEEATPMNAVGVTPIAESALSPSGGGSHWYRPSARGMRDPSSARTATPGSYGRKRFPSVDRNLSVEDATPIIAPPRRATPQTAIDTRSSSVAPPTIHKKSLSKDEAPEPVLLSAVAYDPSNSQTKSTKLEDALPSPAPGVFTGLRSRSRNGSRTRKPDDLHLNMGDAVIREGLPSGRSVRGAEPSPPLTGASMTSLKSSKIRSIDQYISSLDEANHYARSQRSESRRRTEESRERKSRSRQPSETRSTGRVRYIKPAKRSPSSPVSMSPDDATLYNSNTESGLDERYYSVTSPTESRQGRTRSRSLPRAGRASSKASKRGTSKGPASRAASRARSRQPSPEKTTVAETTADEDPEVETLESAVASRTRHRSTSRRPGERGTSVRRDKSPDRRRTREQSASRRPTSREEILTDARPTSPPAASGSRRPSKAGLPRLNTDLNVDPAALKRKEQAARELEERRLSLARRPSAPVIPHPEELQRISLGNRSVTDFGPATSSPILPSTSYSDRITRSQTVDPEAMARYHQSPRFFPTGISTPSAPIGLPATPRAMRHPRYMGNEQDVPAVPSIPKIHSLQYLDSTNDVQEAVDAAPLLPATTYGQPVPPLARAASAPPEKLFPSGRRGSAGSSQGHARRTSHSSHKRISPPEITASIDAFISSDSNVVVVGEPGLAAPANPPLLPELQHLAGPPPPPPPPSMFQPGHKPQGSLGVINIAIAEDSRENTPSVEVVAQPPAMPAPPTTSSPATHRRGRGSISDIGNHFRRATERMRSTSRSRNKSPPVADFTPSPYESIVPPFNFVRRDSNASHIKSPSNGSESSLANAIPPPPPPPPAAPVGVEGGALQNMEVVIPPEADKKPQSYGGYIRNPKEIRANMPPAQLQLGVEGSGMI